MYQRAGWAYRSDAGLVQQAGDGGTQGGGLVGTDVELVRVHQHQVIARGMDVHRLQAGPGPVARVGEGPRWSASRMKGAVGTRTVSSPARPASQRSCGSVRR
jgi:hypothetical protein